MVFVAEAFAGWLVGRFAGTSHRHLQDWLLGSDQQRALRQAATVAIRVTAEQLRPKHPNLDDVDGADHLARVIDQVFDGPSAPAESLAEHATLLEGLQAGVAARLAPLGDADLTGTLRSSAEVLNVSVPALLQSLTSRLLREILARGAEGGPLAPLADQLNHDLTHLQGQLQSASLGQLTTDQQSMLAILERLDQQAKPILATPTAPVGRPVDQLTNPFALEVHPAIDAVDGTASLPPLPAYVQREHDRTLEAVVKQAADGRSMAAVLVGGSSTGKTRACWEAVQGLPPGWRLWHPIDPSRPGAVAVALPAVGPRTVIWLNEAQHYLLFPARELREQVAAGLRELLREPERGPVLVIGTIWPEYWAALTTPPKPEQQDDPYAQARQLLIDTYIQVPDAFTGPELETLQAAARTDPRLAEAIASAEDGRITQFLAGGPALLERYRTATPVARAVIEAAIDIRDLGHSLWLPHRLLKAAAPGYITDYDWHGLAEDWLEQALTYCAEPCRGARAPLTRRRLRPDQPPQAQPHYRLADYLEQAGRALRRTAPIPAGLWDALVVHANEQDLSWIGYQAEQEGLDDQALRLYRRAFDAGYPDALRQAVSLLERADRIDEAIDWCQRAADAGDHDAFVLAAKMLEQADRIDEAIDWYQRAADAGDRDADWRVIRLLELADRVEEAIDWYQRAADAGLIYGARQAAKMLERTDRVEEAIGWYQRSAELGDHDARWQAIRLLERADRVEEAIAWLQQCAEDTGDHGAIMLAAGLLEGVGRVDEAIGWYQRSAELGDHDARWQAIRLLERADRVEEAIAWLQRCAEDTGDHDARWQAIRLLERADRVEEAIAWLHRRGNAGDHDAFVLAAELLEE